jgi:hypothetical protein
MKCILRLKRVSTGTSNTALLLIKPAVLTSIKQTELRGQFYEPLKKVSPYST